MGAFLAAPKTEKHSEYGGSKDNMTSEYGATAMQGWRQTMEDAHVAIPSFRALIENSDTPPSPKCARAFAAIQSLKVDDIGVYGVFDGHGSNAVSQWTAANLLNIFSERLLSILADMKSNGSSMPRGFSRAGRPVDSDLITTENAVLCQAIEDAFLAVDEQIQTSETRLALEKLFENGQREQEGSETYFEWFMKNGGDARVVEVNGQRYIQLLVSSEGGDENQDEGSRLEDVSQEAPEAINGDETPKQPTKPQAFGRLDSTNVDSIKYSTPHSTHHVDEENPEGSVSNTEYPHKDEVEEEADVEATNSDMEKQNQKEDSTLKADDESEYQAESCEYDSCDNPASQNSPVDTNICVDCPEDSQKSDHPHPSSPEGSGATSVVAIVVSGPNPVLIVANAGDSRGVISRGGVAYPLSHDHKPMNPGEHERIIAAGGCVINGRVDGNLNLSRSLGDLFYKADPQIPPEKQRITAFPDVRVTPICKDDEFVILACDGIWDCKTNQEAVDFVRSHVMESNKPSAETLRDACEKLCDDCLSADPIKSEGHGCDNMTVVIFDLSNQLREQGSSMGKVVLYGGGEDMYLGRDETEYETEDAAV